MTIKGALEVGSDEDSMTELNLFWADDGWLVDLREYRQYPIYGEWGWIARVDNAGIGFRPRPDSATYLAKKSI